MIVPDSMSPSKFRGQIQKQNKDGIPELIPSHRKYNRLSGLLQYRMWTFSHKAQGEMFTPRILLTSRDEMARYECQWFLLQWKMEVARENREKQRYVGNLKTAQCRYLNHSLCLIFDCF